MKAMIMSDLILCKRYSLGQLLIIIIMGVAICYASGSFFSLIPIIAAGGPFVYLLLLTNLDDNNNWGRFRLTLPISRTHVMAGRYVSMLLIILGFAVLACALAFLVSLTPMQNLFAPTDLQDAGFLSGPSYHLIFGVVALSICVMLFMSAVTIPIIARFGMILGGRLVPLAMFFLVFLGSYALGGLSRAIAPDAFDAFLSWVTTPGGTTLAVTLGLIFFLALYAVSFVIANRMYKNREF